MSTATEISRLITARNKIRDKMIELGLGVNTDKLDVLANEVDSITNRGSVSATVREGDTYTIPAGYHNGSGTVSGVAGGGNYNLQSKSVTPTKNQQSITPDNGYYGLSDVTVYAIPEAYQNVTSVTASAGDVLANKIIVDSAGIVTAGTMANNGAVNKTLNTATGNQIYTIPAGYHNGSGTVSIALESKDVTPTESAQTIIPTSGKVISVVSIDAIPSNYVGSNIAQNSSGDLIISGATVTAPSGYYAAAASKTIPSGSAKTPATSITANPAISISASGLITATASATKSITPTVSAGYITAGTAGTATVSGSSTSQLDTQTAVTITPSTAQQTVGGAGKFMTGAITVSSIPSAYQNVTSVTAVASHVLASDIFIDSTGAQIIGTMPTINNSQITLSSFTIDPEYSDLSWYEYNIPSGYHTGNEIVLIGGQIKTATPATSTIILEPNSGNLISKVTINAIPSQYKDISGVTAIASHVVQGEKFVNSSGTITGTMSVLPSATVIFQDWTEDSAWSDESHKAYIYNLPIGYNSTERAFMLDGEIRTVTPTTSSQVITANTYDLLEKVTVNSIPSKYGDTSTDTAVASYLLSGYKAHTKSGTSAVQITGTMTNNGAVNGSIDGLTVLSYAIPSGYTTGGTISLTNDIETALAAI